jgi:DNA-binding NarL/FixJ family response regulator
VPLPVEAIEDGEQFSHSFKNDEIAGLRYPSTLRGNMGAKKVFIVGVQPSRERLKGSLATSAFKPIGGSITLAEAYSSLCGGHGEAERANVLLIVVHDRFDGDEEEMLHAIRAKLPAMKFVVLGDPDSLGLFWRAYPTGIDGYLLHDMPHTMFMYALDLVMSGEQILPPCAHAARPVPRGIPALRIAVNAPIRLSTREAQILQQFVGGASSKAIAGRLGISREMVKDHISAIIRKLKASSRVPATH